LEAKQKIFFKKGCSMKRQKSQKTLILKFGKGVQKFIVENEDSEWFYGRRVAAKWLKLADMIRRTGRFPTGRGCQPEWVPVADRERQARGVEKQAVINSGKSKIRKDDPRILSIED
jgi:hypothetical protein